MFRAILTAMVSFAALPSGAAKFDFLAPNGMPVEARADGEVFHVPWRGDSDPAAFWCVAGEYVVRGLNRSAGTRIFRADAPPRRPGEGITFTLDPADARPSGLALISRDRGMSAAHARLLCNADRF